MYLLCLRATALRMDASFVVPKCQPANVLACLCGSRRPRGGWRLRSTAREVGRAVRGGKAMSGAEDIQWQECHAPEFLLPYVEYH